MNDSDATRAASSQGGTMSTTRPISTTDQKDPSVAAVGVIIFAVVLMVIQGFMQAFEGLVALVNDSFYVVGEEYVFQFDVTTWGWIHVIIGTVSVLAGVFLLKGATWARVVAVVMASIGIIANFLWMPYYPLWSLTLIGFDVVVIWAVTAHGRDILAD
jgi:hypothetical protein